MPTNLYGLGDNYELQGSYVFPAMIRKFHEAKASGEDVVHLWGDGSPLCEFLYGLYRFHYEMFNFKKFDI